MHSDDFKYYAIDIKASNNDRGIYVDF